MGLIFTVTAALILWVVLWSLDVKGFDAFMLSTVIILLAATVRLLGPYLPGRGND